MARQTVEDQLRVLVELKRAPVSDELRQTVRRTLASPHSFLAARAADVAREKGLRDLIPDLVAGFDRFLDESDRGCEAKVAIVRALHELDHDDPAVFLKGIHICLSFGNPDADAAVPLRACCAIALARQRHRGVLTELTPLLVDPASRVRAAAAQAIAATGRPEGQLLLRLKVLTGDRDPDVIMECFTAILQLAREEALGFVAGYLNSTEESIQEAAALTLGASRLPGAFEALRRQWSPALGPDFLKVLLMAMASLRSDAAMDFLLGLIRDGNVRTASAAITALKVAKSDTRIRTRIEATLAERGELGLTDVLAREFA
jgi:HEAT repeat protein